jgi:hypothetical protein
MRRLRRAHILLERPKEIFVGLLIIVVAATTTGLFTSLHRSAAIRPVTTTEPAPEAGGGGAFVPATDPTTTTVPPTTTTAPPTTEPAPAPPTTAAPRTVVRAAAPPPPPPPPPAPLPHFPVAAVGVYSGAGNPSGAAGFARDTGAHVTVVGDYLPGGSWATIDGSGGSLAWELGQWHGTGYRLELGVPMFATSGETDSLAVGATGAYNGNFATLARTLVAAGDGNAILRLGQEFTGSWNPWRVTNATDAANYAQFYRQIVSAMRTVPGQAFKFIWEGADPQDGSYNGAYTADQTYPGDGYVDYIGSDTYDQSWVGSCGLAFNNTTSAGASMCSWNTNTLPGLDRVAAFAAAHAKPVVFPEWGLADRGDGHGMGDDPTFVEEMAWWIAGHNVAFDIYFDFDVSGQVDAITDGNFPASLAAYHAGFG